MMKAVLKHGSIGIICTGKMPIKLRQLGKTMVSNSDFLKLLIKISPSKKIPWM